jgi:uncharacterized protein (DUF488 family)
MKVFTIGFTKKSAQMFFVMLRNSGARRVVDVRLNNVSQLAGFAKRGDLEFFLHEICRMDYIHAPILAPTQGMLDRYKKEKGAWSAYTNEFLSLMKERKVEQTVPPEVLADGCLLCSEDKPDKCHRRLVAEYLQELWPDKDIQIVHLV